MDGGSIYQLEKYNKFDGFDMHENGGSNKGKIKVSSKCSINLGHKLRFIGILVHCVTPATYL